MSNLIAGLWLVSTAVAAAETVSFGADIVPLLKRHCVICHMTGDEPGDISLHPDAYGNIVSVPSSQSALPLIEPGSAETSYFYHKLVGTHMDVGGTGTLMPFQRPALDAADIEAIRLWIEQGAKQN